MQCNAMQCNAMQCNAMQCNAMQYNMSWRFVQRPSPATGHCTCTSTSTYRCANG